ncbi:MAG: c-type cytochrome [Solirubrobacteraceae bacterium]|nr:c-type cytochrome [Solirubrobacteraceae bacterium]
MRLAPRLTAFAIGCCSLFALSACGSQEIGIAKSSPYYKGAELFDQRCSGCHSLDITGAHGSSVKASDKEPSDGPNFNQRHETRENVLYALRNGGFSGAVMPQNLATGADAEALADFLAKYAGKKAKAPAAPAPAANPSADQGEGEDEAEGVDSTTPADDSATTPAETTP